MTYGFFDFLSLIGALGFFIYGMKVMSEGIQKAAGERLRQILSTITQNRFFGILTGFLITAIIQSSSATTVMTISFVNAGLLSLTESIGVIMGANVGTTITAWLISIFGFGKVSISALSLPIIAVALPLLFSSKSKIKSIGESLIGFAILFLGLAALKDSVPDLNNNPEVLTFLNAYIDSGILSTLLFVFVGFIITLIVQSSSAAMALTLTLMFNGVITFEIAAAMVLGENIGTTITANIAALVANVHAKRAARAHFLFNLFGVCWMILVFPWFIELVQQLWNTFFPLTSSSNLNLMQHSEELQLALFHTLFNVFNVIVLAAFVPNMVQLVKKIVPSKSKKDELFRLNYLSSSFVHTPELGLLEVKKEIVKLGTITSNMSQFSRSLLLSVDVKKTKNLFAEIKHFEELTDKMEEQITHYLLKLSATELSETTSIRVRAILSIASDLERIADLYYQMSTDVERKNREKLWFTPEQRNRLMEMYDLLDEAFDVMIVNLNAVAHGTNFDKVKHIEKKINKKRNEIRTEYLGNFEPGESSIKGGIIYNNLFSSAEKIGDHIYNISESLKEAF